MRNEEVVRNFVAGASGGQGSNLYIAGNKLVNYRTVIAKRQGSKVLINKKHYSKTTSTHQNRLKRFSRNYELVEEGDLN